MLLGDNMNQFKDKLSQACKAGTWAMSFLDKGLEGSPLIPSVRHELGGEGRAYFFGSFFFFWSFFFFLSIFLVFPKKTTIPSIFLKDLMHFRGFWCEKQ